MAALPMGVHLPLEPALAMPSSTTSAVKFIACRHSCTPTQPSQLRRDSFHAGGKSSLQQLAVVAALQAMFQ